MAVGDLIVSRVRHALLAMSYYGGVPYCGLDVTTVMYWSGSACAHHLSVAFQFSGCNHTPPVARGGARDLGRGVVVRVGAWCVYLYVLSVLLVQYCLERFCKNVRVSTRTRLLSGRDSAYGEFSLLYSVVELLIANIGALAAAHRAHAFGHVLCSRVIDVHYGAGG